MDTRLYQELKTSFRKNRTNETFLLPKDDVAKEIIYKEVKVIVRDKGKWRRKTQWRITYLVDYTYQIRCQIAQGTTSQLYTRDLGFYSSLERCQDKIKEDIDELKEINK